MAKKKKSAAKASRKKKATKKPAPPPRKPVSMNAYAKLRGVSFTAVRKALDSGRLQRSVTKVGRRYFVDIEAADKEWAANTQPVQQRDASAGPTNTVDTLFGPERVESSDPEDRSRIVDNQAARLGWQAKLAELQYLEKKKELVDKEQLLREVFAVFHALRDALFQIPDRTSPIYAAETNARKVHAMQIQEFTKVLNELERAMRGVGNV